MTTPNGALTRIEILYWVSAITSAALLGMMILTSYQLNRIWSALPELRANQQIILERLADE